MYRTTKVEVDFVVNKLTWKGDKVPRKLKKKLKKEFLKEGLANALTNTPFGLSTMAKATKHLFGNNKSLITFFVK